MNEGEEDAKRSPPKSDSCVLDARHLNNLGVEDFAANQNMISTFKNAGVRSVAQPQLPYLTREALSKEVRKWVKSVV